MHPGERLGIMVVVAEAVEDAVHGVEEQFPLRSVAALGRLPGRLVRAGDDVDVDPRPLAVRERQDGGAT